jgi:hypothetical protein
MSQQIKNPYNKKNKVTQQPTNSYNSNTRSHNLVLTNIVHNDNNLQQQRSNFTKNSINNLERNKSNHKIVSKNVPFQHMVNKVNAKKYSKHNHCDNNNYENDNDNSDTSNSITYSNCDDENEDFEQDDKGTSSVNLLPSSIDETSPRKSNMNNSLECREEQNIDGSLKSNRQNNNDPKIMIEINTNEGHYGKRYPSLTKCEINHLTTYTRKTFFRRCKFVSAGVLHGHMNKFFDHMMIFDPAMRIEKTFHVVKCVKDTLSSRRGYATTQICNKLRGTFFRYLYISSTIFLIF